MSCRELHFFLMLRRSRVVLLEPLALPMTFRPRLIWKGMVLKTEGTYEIHATSPSRDRPISRMFLFYVCSHCGYKRSLMKGGTPHRTVTVELSPEGYLLSCEYLHPDGVGTRPEAPAEPFPARARCPDCLHDSLLPETIATMC